MSPVDVNYLQNESTSEWKSLKAVIIDVGHTSWLFQNKNWFWRFATEQSLWENYMIESLQVHKSCQPKVRMKFIPCSVKLLSGNG